MTDINKEAYKQAEKELLENKVKEIKGYILETLEKIEQKKKEKEKIEEELRILKLDLEDMRNGNFEKIEERKRKSPLARNISVYVPNGIVNSFFNSGWTGTNLTYINDWNTLTSGTYTTSSKIFYL